MENSTNLKCTCRDAQRETSRQQKLKQYLVSGEWPGKRRRKAREVPWSRTKELRANKEDLKSRRKQHVRELKKRKRTKLSAEDMDDLTKDIALLKKFKKRKVRLSDLPKKLPVY